MYDFTFENQGSNTFLVYKLKETDSIDSFDYGMLKNNKIDGILEPIVTTMNNEVTIKFNISSKIALKQYFEGVVNKKRILTAFSTITNAALTAEEYMLEPTSFLFDLNYIFVNVSTAEAQMICLPILNKPQNTDIAAFFKNIMFSTQFDQTENSDYVAKIISYLNGTTNFSLLEFKKVLAQMINNVQQAQPQQAVAPMRSSAAMPQASVARPPMGGQPMQQARPMNAAPQGNMQRPMNAAPQGNAQRPMNAAPQGNMQRPMNAVPQGNMQRPMGAAPQGNAQRPMGAAPQAAAPAQEEHKEHKGFFGGLFGGKKKEQASAPAAPQNPGVLLPGQNTALPTMNGAAALPTKGAAPAAPKGGNMQQKPMGAAPQGNAQRPMNQAPQGRPMGAPQGNMGRPPMGGQPMQQQRPPMQQSFQQPSFQQPFTPAPSSSAGFGETTVLGGGNDSGGETTVLGGGDAVAAPVCARLIRRKNNETIPINKPFFKLGKERSFVDYYVDSGYISRSHANIINRDGTYYVVDNNSRNHTYVNDQLLQSNMEVKLQSGDIVRLADEEFEFRE